MHTYIGSMSNNTKHRIGWEYLNQNFIAIFALLDRK